MSSRKKNKSTKKQGTGVSAREQPRGPSGSDATRKKFVLSLPDPALILHILLGLTLVMILVSRIYYLPIPLDRDEGAYGYLGWMALSGGKPYVDFYEMKPPLLFYAYAVIIALFGKSTIGLHLAAAVINVVCTWFVYRIGHELWKSRSAAAIAAIVFLIFGMHLFATGYAMQSEHVVLIFALPGLFYTLRGASTENTLTLSIGGILLACSALVKQNGIFFCAAGLLIVLMHALRPGKWRTKEALPGILSFAIGGILPVVTSIILLLLVGSFEDFWYWIYQYPQRYLSSVDLTDAKQLWERSIKGVMGGHVHWFINAGLGLLLLPFDKTLGWRGKASLFVLVVFSFFNILPGLRFYGHYWLCAFPGLALLIVLPFTVIPGLIRDLRWQNISRQIVVLIMLLITGFHFYNNRDLYYKADFERILNAVHKGNYFYTHKQIGDLLNARMQDKDELIVLGSEPQLYLYTGKKSPTRHFYTSFTSKAIPEAAVWEQEAIDDIKFSEPEYLILFVDSFAWMFEETSTRNLYNFAYRYLRQHYTRIALVELHPQGKSRIIEGEAAQTYQPTTKHYIIISQRNP